MFEFHDYVGFVGAILILVAYMLLQAEKLSAASFWYSFLNFVGGLLFIFSLTKSPNYTAVFIEIIWMAVSLYGMWRHFKMKKFH